MNKGFTTILGVIIGLLVVGGGVYYFININNFSFDSSNDSDRVIIQENKDNTLENDASYDEKETITVKIVSADYDSNFNQAISFKEVEIPKTDTVLDETLKYFFNYEQGIPWLGQTIKYSGVILDDEGIAKVYLEGFNIGTDTGLQEQTLFASISETALQFSSVNDVELYNNGQATAIYYSGSAFGICFPSIDDLEELPSIHSGGEYVNDPWLTIHRYYKKGLALEIVYSGLRDDSLTATKYQATLKRSNIELSELDVNYDDYNKTCSNWSLPAWEIGQWENVGFQCAQGRGHQYFSKEPCQ